MLKIIIFIIIVIILLLILRSVYVKKYYYFKCPECHYQWNPRFIETFGNINCLVDGYLVRCPKCGKRHILQLKNKNLYLSRLFLTV